jgi:hypothetical protein
MRAALLAVAAALLRRKLDPIDGDVWKGVSYPG